MTPAKFQIAKNQKEKMILTVMVAALLIGGYFYLLIKPAIAELMVLAPKVSSLRRDLATSRNLINSRPMVEMRKSELDQKIKEFEKIFPREREIPKLLAKLSEVAGGSGVKIKGIKPIGLHGYG
ncbi:MAG: type 4a pilus biogenesis protein PilO, partial [Candidatus Omnitrophota bacterium]